MDDTYPHRGTPILQHTYSEQERYGVGKVQCQYELHPLILHLVILE